jgi:hypothetical protein
MATSEPVGALRVLVEGDTAQLAADLDRAYQIGEKFGIGIRRVFDGARGALNEFASALGPLPGLLSGAGFAAWLVQGARVADQLEEQAERLGLTVTRLQAYQAAALEAGLSTQKFEAGMNKLNERLGAAAAGEDAALKTFFQLGVAIYDVNGKLRSGDAVMRDTVNSLAAMEEQGKKTDLSMQAFGRGGTAFVAGLKDATADIDAFTEKARAMGLVLDEGIVRSAAKIQDQFDIARRSIELTGTALLVKLAPAVQTIINLVNEAIEGWRQILMLFGTVGPDAEELARRIAQAETEIANKFAAMGQMAADDPYVRQMIKLRDESREALRAVNALDAAMRATQRQPTGPAEAPAGAPTPPGAAKAQKALEAAQKKAAADAFKLGMDDLKQQEELSKLVADYWKKTYESETKDLDAKTKREYDAARETLSLQEETNRLSADYHRKNYESQIKDIEAKLKREYDAAAQELQLQQEVNEAVNKYRLAQSENLDKELAKRVAPVRDLFDSLDRALTGSVMGVLQGTQTIGQAFERMGVSIATSIGEKAIKQGLDALEKAITDFLKSDAFTTFVEWLAKLGVTIGGAFTGGGGAGAIAGAAPAATQTINIDFDQGMATGGIVQSPSIRLLGEAGPEAVIPLDRLDEFGSSGVQVNVINQAPAVEVTHQRRTTPTGTEVHDLVIRELRRMVGTGEMEGVMAPYALRRVPTNR